jgi:ATP-dependent protease ClpP protease subunit
MAAVVLNFSGPTNYPASKNLRNALCLFGGGQPNQNFGGAVFTELYLLMNSDGGSIEDALSLFNLLKGLPVELTTVNMGQVASAAILPFLAGKNRYACAHSYFHFHNIRWTYDRPQTVERSQMLDHSQIVDMERALIRDAIVANTLITNKMFDDLKLLEHPLVERASFAQQKGIVQNIGMPTLPKGAPILNVDY